ncbi:MAG: ABC transporter substrate-binding protein [Burkholderiales bacterium]
MDLVHHRRLLLGLLAAGTGWSALGALFPRLALAQPARMTSVAVLFIGESEDEETNARPFFETMARLGWVEGKNVAYDRHGGKGTRPYLGTMVSNATGNEPQLIVATTASLALAVAKENTGVPMVFITMNDPVAAGLVASLKKPGRNATGSYQVQGDAAVAKRFQLVHQALPGIKRLGAVFDRNAADYQQRRALHEKTARAHSLELVSMEFTNFEAIAKIFAQLKRDGIPVCEVTPSFALTGRRREAVQLAERNGLAIVAHRAEWADAGAIFSYGVDIGENYRRAAVLADRILKGAKPADLPVERPNRLELVANQKAALALGISLPKSILAQASRVVS